MNLNPPNISNWLFDKNIPRRLTHNNTITNQIVEQNKNKEIHKLDNIICDRNVLLVNNNNNNNNNSNNNNNNNIITTSSIPKNSKFTTIFKHLETTLQNQIVSILINQFNTKLDINNTTKIHQIWNNNNILIALACSEYDEIVGNILRNKGCKDIETLGIRSDGVYLYNLWVTPSYRHKGIGKHIISYIEEYYTYIGKKSIRVQVEENNNISLQLFRNLDYLIENKLIDNKGNIQINLSKWL